MRKLLQVFRDAFSEYFWYLCSMSVLSVIVHLTLDRVEAILAYLESLNLQPKVWIYISKFAYDYAYSIKGVIFLPVILVLFSSILRDIYQVLKTTGRQKIIQVVGFSIVTAALLMFLNFQVGILSMGEGYGEKSINPFVQNFDWYSTRLLMPALAHILFFRGPWLYYMFSFLITLIFIIFLFLWNEDHTKLSKWQFISLCTSSFVLYQFQFPGYPDILVFLFFVLIMSNDLSQKSKLYLLSLSLIAYESSFFIGIILAWQYLRKKEQIAYLTTLILYGIIWFSFSKFNFIEILSSHNVSNLSGLQWVHQQPFFELLGVFVAYKAVWFLFLLGLGIAGYKRMITEFLLMVSYVFMGISMTFLGVDTSRLMGFSFPGFLIALSLLENVASDKLKRTMSFVWLVNLIIPSIYVGLNTGIGTWPGLYGLWYSCIVEFGKRTLAFVL